VADACQPLFAPLLLATPRRRRGAHLRWVTPAYWYVEVERID
jgi:hypothetical protein